MKRPTFQDRVPSPHNGAKARSKLAICILRSNNHGERVRVPCNHHTPRYSSKLATRARVRVLLRATRTKGRAGFRWYGLAPAHPDLKDTESDVRPEHPFVTLTLGLAPRFLPCRAHENLAVARFARRDRQDCQHPGQKQLQSFLTFMTFPYESVKEPCSPDCCCRQQLRARAASAFQDRVPNPRNGTKARSKLAICILRSLAYGTRPRRPPQRRRR